MDHLKTAIEQIKEHPSVIADEGLSEAVTVVARKALANRSHAEAWRNHSCPTSEISNARQACLYIIRVFREKSDADRQKICDALMGCHERDLEFLL